MMLLLDSYDSTQLWHTTYEPAGQIVCCHSHGGGRSSVHESGVSRCKKYNVVLAESSAFRAQETISVPSGILYN